MSEPKYAFEFVLGSIRLGQPTGRWIQRQDGGWVQEWTPTQYLDAHGRVERSEPMEGAAILYGMRPRQFEEMGFVAVPHSNPEKPPRKTLRQHLKALWDFFA